MQLLDQQGIFNKNQDGGRRHLDFQKSVAISWLLDQSWPNWMGMLRIWQQTQLLDQKWILAKTKMAAAAILNFEKLLPFLHYWTNPHRSRCECWGSDIERNCLIKKAQATKIEMAAAALLLFENLLLVLHHWTNLHQLWWDCCESDVERKCSCQNA